MPERLGQVVGLDFMGPFPERKVGKKRFVLTMVDMLTRKARAWAMAGAGGRHYARFKGVDTGTRNTFSLMI